jgi:hypothetical protein
MTSPTGGGRSVGTVRLRTIATEFSFIFESIPVLFVLSGALQVLRLSLNTRNSFLIKLMLGPIIIHTRIHIPWTLSPSHIHTQPHTYNYVTSQTSGQMQAHCKVPGNAILMTYLHTKHAPI